MFLTVSTFPVETLSLQTNMHAYEFKMHIFLHKIVPSHFKQFCYYIYGLIRADLSILKSYIKHFTHQEMFATNFIQFEHSGCILQKLVCGALLLKLMLLNLIFQCDAFL